MQGMRISELIVDGTDIVDVDVGALACALPPAYCHPPAIRRAQEEGLSLLAWWRDLGQNQSQGIELLDRATELIEQLTPDVVRERAAERAEPLLVALNTIRDNLDASKGLADTTDAAGQPSEAAKAWFRLNAEWYATMGALANGIHLSDTETGELVLPEGAELVFGDAFIVTDAVVASKWDGIDFGALYAEHIENGGSDFGAVQLAPVMGVFLGLLALAIVLNVTNWTDNAVVTSANMREAAKDLDKLTIQTKVQPLGGAGGAIIALALVAGTVFAVAKVSGKELKLPRPRRT